MPESMRELKMIFSDVVKFIAHTAEILMKTQLGTICCLGRTSLWAGLALLSLSVAAVGQDTAPSGEKCKIEASAGFRTWASPLGLVSADFIVAPENSVAAWAQQKRHVLHSLIFADLVSHALMAPPGKACGFTGVSKGAALNFERFFLGKDDASNCGLNRCLRRLATTIQDMKPSPDEVSEAAAALASHFKRADAREPEYLRDGVSAATNAIFKHIYPPDWKQRGYFDRVLPDLDKVSVQDFLDWLAIQQRALRTIQFSKPDGPSTLFEELPPTCVKPDKIDVEEIHIDDHGRGQKAVVLIKEGYEYKQGGGRSSTINALCYQKRTDAFTLLPEIPRDMSCWRSQTDDSRWITLHSNARPVHDFSTMRQLAYVVAKSFQQEQCVPAGLRIFVVEYLQQ